MTLKKTKPTLMALAGLAVLFYHLFPWPRGGSLPEVLVRYLLLTAYIGVDIFFFTAGYMAYFSKTHPYPAYIKRKFSRIYPAFFLFALLALLMGRLDLGRFLMALTGMDLFRQGGGAFLWFLPALLLTYLVLPFYKDLVIRRGPGMALALGWLLWAGLMAFLVLLFGDLAVNIFLCRLPLVFLGTSLASMEGRWPANKQLILGLVFFLPGLFVTWNWASFSKAVFVVKDSFYLLAIPQTLGLILLLDLIFRPRQPSFLVKLGGITLELYALQMVMGPPLLDSLIKGTSNRYLAFLFSSLILLALSVLWQAGQKRLTSWK